MKHESLIYAIGGIVDQYISEAAEDESQKGAGRRASSRRRAIFLAAAAAAALLLCGAAAYVAAGGDLWWQIPSDSPEEVVREALEQQENKDYTISIEIESVAVDPEETARARDEYISGVIAQRRGWSDEYLKEHFTAVKAVYHAQYDHTKTTRSDGDVVMYFYLVRDVDSGKWSIVDNTGNLELTKDPGPQTDAPIPSESGPETDATAPSAPPSFKEQITAYLTDQFTKKYAQFYDGLRYEMSGYEETVEDGVCTATFIWTNYFLGKGWDVGSDEGVEQEANWPLQVTAQVDGSGMLDLSTILVYQDHGQTSGPDYQVLEEFSAPLPRIQWRKQIQEYMTGRYGEKYASLCDNDSLNCYLSYYEEKEKDGVCTAAFLLTVLYPGDDGFNEVDIYDVQLTAAVGEDGLLDMGAVSILMENQLPDRPEMDGPGFPSWQQVQVEAYLTELFNRAYSPYYDGLHYAIRQEDYQEIREDGVYTATFLWTMYHLGKGWDVPGDEGVEQEGNMHLRVTAAIKDSGVLDLDTISVLLGTGARGPMVYSSPIEELFPPQSAGR